jgi:hypothetical protein
MVVPVAYRREEERSPREGSTKPSSIFLLAQRFGPGLLDLISSLPVMPRSRVQITAAGRRLTPILR